MNNGRIYDGEWSFNERHGKGVLYYLDTLECFKSIFCFGKKVLELWPRRYPMYEISDKEKSKFMIGYLEEDYFPY